MKGVRCQFFGEDLLRHYFKRKKSGGASKCWKEVSWYFNNERKMDRAFLENGDDDGRNDPCGLHELCIHWAMYCFVKEMLFQIYDFNAQIMIMIAHAVFLIRHNIIFTFSQKLCLYSLSLALSWKRKIISNFWV